MGERVAPGKPRHAAPQRTMLAVMNPFTSLATLPRRLRHPAVRDLAWTLVAPPLLERLGDVSPRHPLHASGWAVQPDRLERWLRQLDRDPQHLLAATPGANGKRLGRYYEELWQFALAQAPDIRLLAGNLPIRDHGRTLGELDLLIEDDEGLQHIELAVKLYLGPTQAPGDAGADWLGPGRRDRLDLKLEHLLRHQLPLSAHPQAHALLRRLSSQVAQASPWLAGYLFYPWPTPCKAPRGAADGHLHGRWVRRCDWPLWLAVHDGNWQPLARLHWLAPHACTASDVWSRTQLNVWLHELPDDSAPRMLVCMKEEQPDWWQEQERIFLVNDHWPQPLTTD